MLMLFKERAFDLAALSDSSLGVKTAYNPLQEIFATSGKHISCFGKSSWMDHNSFRLSSGNSASTNCFESRNVVRNADKKQDRSNV